MAILIFLKLAETPNRIFEKLLPKIAILETCVSFERSCQKAGAR